MNEIIQFKQQRELGTILTDIFKFIRLNWKPLFGLILQIAGPALLVLVGAYVYYMQSFFGSLGITESIAGFENFGLNTSLSVLFLFLSAVVYYCLLNGVILHYVKSYINHNGAVSQDEVKAGVKNDFWKLLGTSLMVGLITMVGIMFCILPGIYFGVVLTTAFAIVVFERRDVMETISYCFKLIKDEWWMTFATILVIFLLFYFINFIFQVPQYIYFFIKGVTMTQIISADPAMMFDWVYIALTSIALLFQYLLYTIIVLGAAFIYFNLNEKKNYTGTLETIDSLGSSRDEDLRF